MKQLVKKLIYGIMNRLLSIHRQYLDEKIYQTYNIHPSVKFWNVSFEGNIEIGNDTYINEGTRIDSGPKSKVVIGRHCAIGRYVHITSKTHDLVRPTTTEYHKELKTIEKSTSIGNYVWIGDKVFINLGVTIGDHAIIGANSVVLKDVKPFEVVAGAPAKHIKTNHKSSEYNNDLFNT